MPGVFYFSWDNCEYGEKYKHRQIYLTNMPFLALLSKDCQGGHEHLQIGFGKALSTKAVEAYSLGWCREFARLFRKFVERPSDDTCVHCLPSVRPDSNIRRETMRRCAERVNLGDTVDSWMYSLETDLSGEVFLSAKVRHEVVLAVTTRPCRPLRPLKISTL